MATITTETYLDSATRTAAEVFTINGGTLIVRTDTRYHAYAPASGVGTFVNASATGSNVISATLGGTVRCDGRNVRWLPFNSGSGNVPAIGTNITQDGVSTSYLLGVYASLTVAPTTAGSAMPTSGFIKFREVTGTFVSGALTGIGASATGPDVTGWIEIVGDQAAAVRYAFNVPRLGKFECRGDWFYLDNTTGSIGQILQVPTNGGGAGTECPGCWIETSPGSNEYEYWPSLHTAAGWTHIHQGEAESQTDRRQSFVKNIGSGQMQIGETYTHAATYASVAAQASTYAGIATSGTYLWANDKVTVYCSGGHGLNDGQSVGLDFTTGSATDGIFTITILDGYRFEATLAGSGTGGNVTVRPGILVTFTAHGLNIGEQVNCDFTSGTGVDGVYTVYGVPSANTYQIGYAHTADLTSGNVSCLHTLVCTFTSHGLALGQKVYLDFTSGTGVDGVYTIKVVATNTYSVNMPHTATTSGNVTCRRTIGRIPASGCKVRVPNVFFRQCTTSTRAVNTAPTSDITYSPGWYTVNAGVIDIEYAYGDWNFQFAQPYSVRLVNVATFDRVDISECASPLDLNNGGTGMKRSIDFRALQLTSNFAGGTIQNWKAQRGNAPSTTDHAVELLYCKGQTLSNVTAGIVQYARSTGYPIQLNYCSSINVNNCRVINGPICISASFDSNVNDLDYVDRYNGITNATTPYYSIIINTKSDNIVVNGLTFGYNGTILDNHPYSGLLSIGASSNIKCRNIGSFSSKLNGGTYASNLWGVGSIFVSGGNNDTLKFQRIYLDKVRSSLLSTTNSDKNVIYESVIGSQITFATRAINSQVDAGLNSLIKGVGFCTLGATGQASVYGTHFYDFAMGPSGGLLVLAMNEPTAETISQFTMVSGTAKFTSSGGILMSTIGDQAIWEDSCFRKGYTGFTSQLGVSYMDGGTASNYTLEYQIDTGSGYNGSWLTINQTNLGAITVDPSIGFKIKIRITTTSTNTTAITFLRLYLISTPTAQQNNLYPLDTNTLTLTDLKVGTEIYAYLGTNPDSVSELAHIESTSGTSWSFSHSSGGSDGYLVLTNPGYQYLKIPLTYTAADISIPVFQTIDRSYA